MYSRYTIFPKHMQIKNQNNMFVMLYDSHAMYTDTLQLLKDKNYVQHILSNINRHILVQTSKNHLSPSAITHNRENRCRS